MLEFVAQSPARCESLDPVPYSCHDPRQTKECNSCQPIIISTIYSICEDEMPIWRRAKASPFYVLRLGRLLCPEVGKLPPISGKLGLRDVSAWGFFGQPFFIGWIPLTPPQGGPATPPPVAKTCGPRHAPTRAALPRYFERWDFP